ncbi:hypothetical protein ABBQ38_012252 [Trebouxia sp. C0009 RCD-2024]
MRAGDESASSLLSSKRSKLRPANTAVTFAPRLPPTERKAPKALQAITLATGRARNSRDVCCCPPQRHHPKMSFPSHHGQHARAQQAQQEGPDNSSLDPALRQQWDHAANAQLGNIIVKTTKQQSGLVDM